MVNPVPNFPVTDDAGNPTAYFRQWMTSVKNSLDRLFLPQQALPSAPLDGALEYDGNEIYFTVGTDRRPLAFAAVAGPLASLPTGLGVIDAGRTYYASDYGHDFRWTGTAWTFAPGDTSGFVVIGKPDGSAPNGGLWGLCDGSAYPVAQNDGTLATVTTQNLTGGVFLKGDAPAAQQAATVPQWAAGAATDPEALHTHQVDPPATNSSTEAGFGTTLQTGTASTITVSAFGHTHLVDVAPFASAHGSSHSHTLAAAALKAPGETSGGLPLRVGVRFYLRR